MRLNIAIDGPVGAGKSTVSDEAARRLGILHLDTGAMYRALGLTALRRNIPTDDEEAVVRLCEVLDISVLHGKDGQHTLADGEDVTGLIRTQEVGMAASTVSRYARSKRLRYAAPAGIFSHNFLFFGSCLPAVCFKLF